MVEVLGGLVDVQLHPTDAAGEPAVPRPVVVAHRCRGVAPDVGGLVGREEHRNRGLHAPVARGLAVHEERHGAALPEPASVVGELHPHLVLARGDGLLAVHLEQLQAEEVVAIGELPVLRVEREAAERPALGEDDPVRAVPWHHDLGRDRVRLVL